MKVSVAEAIVRIQINQILIVHVMHEQTYVGPPALAQHRQYNRLSVASRGPLGMRTATHAPHSLAVYCTACMVVLMWLRCTGVGVYVCPGSVRAHIPVGLARSHRSWGSISQATSSTGKRTLLEHAKTARFSLCIGHEDGSSCEALNVAWSWMSGTSTWAVVTVGTYQQRSVVV